MNLKNTKWMGVIVLLSLLMTGICFGERGYDLDEFDDLELESLDSQQKIPAKKIDKGQGLILFNDNLYLLDDDFDFGYEELELLKLELNPNDIEISKEYEKFLNAFFENSKLIHRPSSSEKSNPPIIKQEKFTPPTENKIEDFTPVDSNSFKEVNPPTIKGASLLEMGAPAMHKFARSIIIPDDKKMAVKVVSSEFVDYKKEETISSKKNQIEDLGSEEPYNIVNPQIENQEQSDISSTTIKHQLSILSRIGFGLNYVTSYNNLGPIIGGSICVDSMGGGTLGVDLMYILIKQDYPNSPLNETKKHTTGITGFYERKFLNKIVLKGGLSYIITGDVQSLGLAAGAGFSFHIGKMLIIQPMADVNFASKKNNTVGLNFNIGIYL